MAKLTSIALFDGGTNGDFPSVPVLDADGNLLGTANGGADGQGLIYEITKTADGYATTPTVLASFDGMNGSDPSPLMIDAAGDLVGVASDGGAHGSGDIFALTRTEAGYASTPTVIASFDGTNGATPKSGVIADAAGDLFGVTLDGGANGKGTVYELAKTAQGYASAPTVIASFDGTDGMNPWGRLVADANGDLFGTTQDDKLFEIAKAASGYASTPVVIATLGNVAPTPSNLSIDRDGNLFGASLFFGGADDAGDVFEIPKVAGGYQSPTILVSFGGPDGSSPEAGVIIDAAGNLWGTTADGGANNAGTVYEIAHLAQGGYASTQNVVVSFDTNGAYLPDTDLAVDAAGDLFGGTVFNPNGENGGVFEVTDTGFVACYARGTRIGTDRGEVAVEALAIGDVVVTHSGVHRAIRWIGRRAYDGRFIGGNRDVLPIRIRAGALDAHVPARDLVVSPHHALYLDGVLVPAEHLINGVSIVQEMQADGVEYFHIELDSHDILLAENTPAESFVDRDSRAMFHNAAEFAALYPQADASGSQFCAERVEGGAVLARIWSRIAGRAGIRATGGVLHGAIDRLDRGAITGWAAGADDTPVLLEIAIDGAAIGRVLANRKRADLADAGFGAGRHGFALALAPLLDPARAHLVAIRRACDGAALPGSPVLLPALPRSVGATPLAPVLAAIERMRRGCERVSSRPWCAI